VGAARPPHVTVDARVGDLRGIFERTRTVSLDDDGLLIEITPDGSPVRPARRRACSAGGRNATDNGPVEIASLRYGYPTTRHDGRTGLYARCWHPDSAHGAEFRIGCTDRTEQWAMSRWPDARRHRSRRRCDGCTSRRRELSDAIAAACASSLQVHCAEGLDRSRRGTRAELLTVAPVDVLGTPDVMPEIRVAVILTKRGVDQNPTAAAPIVAASM